MSNRYYPQQNELKDPERVERVMRRIIDDIHTKVETGALNVTDDIVNKIAERAAGMVKPSVTAMPQLSQLSNDLGDIKAGNIESVNITSVTVTASDIAGTDITGGTVTGATIQTSTSDPRVIIDTANGIRGINASSQTLFQVTTSGAVTLKTAATGARIEIDATNGLRGYDGSGNLNTQITAATGKLYCWYLMSSTYPTTGCALDLGGFASYVKLTEASYDHAMLLYPATSTIASTGVSGNYDMILDTNTASAKVVFKTGTTERAHVDSSGLDVTSGNILVSGTQVVGAQGSAVADASGGSTVDTEARAAINTLLSRLRAHGLIAT